MWCTSRFRILDCIQFCRGTRSAFNLQNETICNFEPQKKWYNIEKISPASSVLFQLSYTFSTVNCQLTTAQCPLSTVHYLLPTVYCPLFTAHYLLSTAHCLMFTAHCSLPTPLAF
jgi:formate hydrogenlyase subunit 4